jgi:pimeloyl-ACP methyl ester carboxylesterase
MMRRMDVRAHRLTSGGTPDVPGGLGLTDVRVDGVRSPVLVGGPPASDEAVVFVHGTPGSSRDWQRPMAQVSTFARCVAPDMPGYADADKPDSFDYTTEGYARHLGGILEQLTVRRAHLVLHDLGGPWGLAWAADNPARLASLTLIDIGALPRYRWHWFARLYRTPVLGEVLLATITRPGLALVLRPGNPRPLPVTFIDGAVRQYRDAGTRRAVLRFYRATPDLGSVTVRAAASLREANPPTLVIWGAEDPYVPVRYAEVQREYFPRAQIVTMARSGHWPLVDDPDGVVSLLVSFLRPLVS